MDGEILSEFFEDHDIFSVVEAWESATCDYNNPAPATPHENSSPSTAILHLDKHQNFEFQKSPFAFPETDEAAAAASPNCKRQKVMNAAAAAAAAPVQLEDGQHRMSHITVERNRRKQMNEHLSVLRSFMPGFYVKRGDQASIIGGVVDYITELQQLLSSLEAKKQRKTACTEILSPRLLSSPRLSLPISPRKPPLSPRLSLPISPRTPQSSSPYKPWMHQQQPSGFLNSSPSLSSPRLDNYPSPCNSSTTSASINDAVNELVASSKSPLAEVDVKFSGPNLLLKTVSHRIPGQVVKIVSALEELALEILQVNISTVDETMLNSFTIKIGIECQLSAEDLAQLIQHTFC